MATSSSTKRRIEELHGGEAYDDDEDMFADGPRQGHFRGGGEEDDVESALASASDSDLDVDTPRGRRRRGLRHEDEYSSATEDEASRPVEEDVGREDYSNEEDEERGLERGGYGFQVTPFNLTEELETGRFDRETGSYVPTKDADGADDTWLVGLTDEDMQKAKRAQERRAALMGEAAGAMDRPTRISPCELTAELLGFMQLGETPTEAIQRRSTGHLSRRFDARSRKMAAARTAEERTADETKRKEIERITGLCSSLMEAGVLDIYELTKEEIQRKRAHL